ncbi:MAG: universal stress protein [Porticoccus sp.]|nr:universal stress protein [Porticoccus sp.]
MYKNILVPTDLADKSELSIHTALTMASQNHGSVQLLHVVEKVGDDADEEIEDFYLKLAEKANQKLSDWQHRFKTDFVGVPIEITILVGKRAQEIIKFSQEKNIDLIVMTSRTFNKGEQGLGTLSHQVSLFAPISVLVVR